MSKACFFGVMERAVVDLAIPTCEVSVARVAEVQIVDMSG